MMVHPRVNILLVCGLLVGAVLLASCERRMVCPAYQSMFILDPEVRLKTFSLFGEDSLPKTEVKVDKDQHLVLRTVNKRKKERSLQTIPMVTIFPPAAIKDTISNSNDVVTETPVAPSQEEKPSTSEGDGF